MNQPTLFDAIETPLARSTDPGTSHQAANEVAPKLNEVQSRMLEAFRIRRTANEAATLCVNIHGGNIETHRKRAGELLRLGQVTETGTRVCGVTGRTARTFIQSLDTTEPAP